MTRDEPAPRLIGEVPSIASLCLDIGEYGDDDLEAESRFTRHVVVERAPALFRFECNQGCSDGGHDFTDEIMAALRSAKANFHGDHVCQGDRLARKCRHHMTFLAHATYVEAPPEPCFASDAPTEASDALQCRP